jgi:ATP-dependent helicase/nuclease subunit B
MTARILLAPPAAGKTHYCIQRIFEVLREHPLGPVWVVVPDRLQSYAFRRRLAIDGGTMGAYVGTFGDLYEEILRRAGISRPVVSDPVIQRLIRFAIERVQQRDGLEYYKAIVEMPGFLRALADIFSEFKRARLRTERLFEHSGEQEPGWDEIVRIYVAYQELLGEIGWTDAEGVNWLATRALEEDPSLVSDWRLLIVDGFDSLNGAQRAALKVLGEIVPEVLLTLPGAIEMSRIAHRRFVRSLEQLTEEIPAQVEQLAGTPHLPKPLAHLECSIFEAGSSKVGGDGHLLRIEARSPRDEAREALRWLKARVVRDGLGLRECALVSVEPEGYRPFLREASVEFGLPLRFSQGEPLSSSPAIAALLDLLQLPLQSFSRSLTLETLRSPYFNLKAYDLSHDDASRLEAVSMHGQVLEGLDQWGEALTRLAGVAFLPDSDESDGFRSSILPTGDAAIGLWMGLKVFAERLSLPAAQSISQWVRWLEDLLDDMRFLEEEKTPRDEASVLRLREILRALVAGESVTGVIRVDADAFVHSLKALIEGSVYQEKHPFKKDAILVLSALEARGLRFRAVAVLGLAEGLFPEIEREDPFLSEERRQELNLEPRLGREQTGLFYQVVTRADSFLLLTRPYLAEDGEYWEASPFWNAVIELFESEPERVHPDAPRPLEQAASREELLQWAVRRKALPRDYAGELRSRWEFLRHARDVLQARQSQIAEGAFEGMTSGLSLVLQERYGPRHVWSASRLETYGSCPYRFYVESALELEVKEPPELGYDALQLGLILHAIMEGAYGQATDPANVESVLQALGSVAEGVFAEAPARYGFRPSPLWDVEQAELSQALEETIRALAETGEGWTPMAYERVFGMRDTPPLEIGVGDVRLRGVIDRLDRNGEGRLRVIDYKTGSSHLESSELIEGRRLQLPLYALAARQTLGSGEPMEGFYWAILNAKAGQLHLERFHH